MKTGYIGEFEYIDDHRSGKIVIELLGRLNKCGIISPRFNVPLTKLEEWSSKILPSRQFGHLVLTTTYGRLSLMKVSSPTKSAERDTQEARSWDSSTK